MTARYTFVDFEPSAGSFFADVVDGLGRVPKSLPPKYFYDVRGCELFEQICELDEYYPTRTEMSMMRDHAAEMAAVLGDGTTLIEYGSGSGRKTRLLIDALRPVAYVSVDIAAAAVQSAGRALAGEYPGMAVTAVCADYSLPLDFADIGLPDGTRRVIYFPGSTIGNFTAAEAREFLRGAAALAGPGGAMLIGVDLKKDAAMLNAAYDDARGVTAAFNLNLLDRINRELDGDFDTSTFSHRAFYSEALGRIEMHLVSRRAQVVRVGRHRFAFEAGETIHTENSCKYSVAEFQSLAQEAGFRPERVWTDAAGLFSIHYLVVPA